jgi:hypothetical protein
VIGVWKLAAFNTTGAVKKEVTVLTRRQTATCTMLVRGEWESPNGM